MSTAPRRTTTTARWVALAAAVTLHLAVLYWPSTPGGTDVPGLDKAVHLTVFGLVAWTGIRAGLNPRWVVGALAAHAVVSELVQHWVLPHRSGDPFDALADVLGAFVGAALALRGRRARMGP